MRKHHALPSSIESNSKLSTTAENTRNCLGFTADDSSITHCSRVLASVFLPTFFLAITHIDFRNINDIEPDTYIIDGVLPAGLFIRGAVNTANREQTIETLHTHGISNPDSDEIIQIGYKSHAEVNTF